MKGKCLWQRCLQKNYLEQRLGAGLLLWVLFCFSYIILLTNLFPVTYFNISNPRPKVLYSFILSTDCFFGWWPFASALLQKISPWKPMTEPSIWSHFQLGIIRLLCLQLSAGKSIVPTIIEKKTFSVRFQLVCFIQIQSSHKLKIK